MMSSANSQQRLSDSTVIVPIKSLRNALFIKAERDNFKNQLGVARDSISSMDSIILRQGKIIKVCDSTRLVLDSIVDDNKNIITQKDVVIREQNNKISDLERTVKLLAGTIVATTLAFLAVLL